MKAKFPIHPHSEDRYYCYSLLSLLLGLSLNSQSVRQEVRGTEALLWLRQNLLSGAKHHQRLDLRNQVKHCSLLLVSLRSLSKGLALPVACTPRDGSRNIDSLQASSVSGTWLLFILVNKSYCQIFNVHTQWPVCVCECVLNNEFLYVSSHIPQI